MTKPTKLINPELQYTIEQGTLDQVQQVLVSLQPDEINNPNKQGYTALHCAVKNGDEELVKLLIKFNCDINKGNNSGQSPLFIACWHNQQKLVKILIQAKADLNLQDNRGWTALMISAYNGLQEIVRLLIQNGADPRIQDSFQKKPIDRAKDPQIIEMLKNAIQDLQQSDVSQSPSNGSRRFLSARTSPPGQRVSTNLTQQSRIEKGKSPNLREEDTILSKQKSQISQSFITSPEKTRPFVNVKDVEIANQLRILNVNLISSSQTLLQGSVQTYTEIAFQNQLAQYEEYIWKNILMKFEQRLYVTFETLQEYMTLKLKVAMAHLGIRLPDDIMIDYQRNGFQEFQEGFQKLLDVETTRLRETAFKLELKQKQEQKSFETRINQLTSQLSQQGSHNQAIFTQNLCNSFQNIMKEQFENSNQQINQLIIRQCPIIEKKIEEKMQELLEKSERNMKNKVEGFVEICVGEVKNRMSEVDGWITRKDQARESTERVSSSPSKQNSNNGFSNQSSIVGQNTIHRVLKNQNQQLREKISQLKSSLSPTKNTDIKSN